MTNDDGSNVARLKSCGDAARLQQRPSDGCAPMSVGFATDDHDDMSRGSAAASMPTEDFMPAIRFINVDLDVSSKHSIQTLTRYLINNGLSNLSQSEDGSASYVLDVLVSSANAALALMLDVLEKLPPDSHEAWRACTRREFNLGFDCGTEPLEFNEAIEPDVVNRISTLGGCFRITLYPHPLS